MAQGPKQDNYLRVKGFTVEIDGEKGGKDSDSNWRRVSGGANVVEVAETTVAGERFKTFAPGHSHITPLVLEGGVTKDRKGMIDWLEATTKGDDSRRKVTIIPLSIEGKPGKQHIYHDCLVEEYTFPDLNSEHHNELHERVVVRSERHTVE